MNTQESVIDWNSRTVSARDHTGSRDTVAASATPVGLVTLFAGTLLLSSALVFFVQPMFAKMALPLLGGSAAVWNTCVVFFQSALLGGYLYTHLLTSMRSVRNQAITHVALLVVFSLSLPIAFQEGVSPPSSGTPIFWLLGLLALSVGGPFLVVSSTAPLLQRWFSLTGKGADRDPYFLYSASNLGSMAALLAYPILVEPRWSVETQSAIWTSGYALLTALITACAVIVTRRVRSRVPESAGSVSITQNAEPITLTRRAKWIALAFVPSSLMLGVTTFASTDIAAVPLLWVVPLSLYLLSFVIAFASREIVSRDVLVRAMAVSMLPVILTTMAGLYSPARVLVPLHLLAFFLTALVLHGELSRERPAARHLTEFYLWIAVGGVLGGLFNTLLAPVVFTAITEYPIALWLACVLRPPPTAHGTDQTKRANLAAIAVLVIGAIAVTGFLRADVREVRWIAPFVGLASVGYFILSRSQWFALAAGLLLLSGELGRARPGELYSERTFFGVHRVRADIAAGTHTLFHGSTLHGVQSLDPTIAREPMAYYHREGPIGQALQFLGARGEGSSIGVVGLGAGGLAAHARTGELWTFYEIDPAVARIATSAHLFTYLRDCGAACSIELGDARLSLANSSVQHDILILDAFSSDAVPVHLLTREAVQLYFNRLTSEGFVAFHISNRHLDLRPALSAIAADLGLSAVARLDSAGGATRLRQSSEWLLMARSASVLAPLASDPRWMVPESHARVWTDGFSDILSALK